MVQSLRKLSRFGGSYYVANLLGIGSYFLLRTLFLLDRSPKSGWISTRPELWYWEKRALWGLLAVFAGKYLNRTSLDALVGEMLLYVKLAAGEGSLPAKCTSNVLKSKPQLLSVHHRESHHLISAESAQRCSRMRWTCASSRCWLRHICWSSS